MLGRARASSVFTRKGIVMIASACVIIHTKEEYGDREITIPCHRHADAFYIISQLLDRDEIDKP